MDDWPGSGRNPTCGRSGQRAPPAWVQSRGWPRHAARVHCHAGGALVAARTGTASASLRPEATTSRRGATALADGWRSRATGRLVDVDKATVHHGRPVGGQPGPHVRPAGFRHLPRHACPVDARWTFLAQPAAPRTPREQRAAVDGEAWGWMACRPRSTRVPAGVVGRRTWRHARRRVWQRQAATEGPLPFGTRAALPQAAAALLDGDGGWGTPPRPGPRRRLPTPRRCPPPAWCDAVVVTAREQGRVVHVMTRLVYGPTAPVEAARPAAPVRRVSQTSGVARHHRTVRPHARRMGRQGQACSSAPADRAPPLTLAFADAHVVGPPRGRRRRLPRSLPTKGGNSSRTQWQPVTPAMAARRTAHVWTMDEWWSVRVPPKPLW